MVPQEFWSKNHVSLSSKKVAEEATHRDENENTESEIELDDTILNSILDSCSCCGSISKHIDQ